jgi:cystathionine beta-lyase/cystathionine gamma-synthase
VILSEQQIYGCTYRLFEKVLRRFGVTIKYANLANVPANYG